MIGFNQDASRPEEFNSPEVEIVYHVYEIVTVFLILRNSEKQIIYCFELNVT